ncbi:MAG: hypothetical protein AAFR54_10910 [Planctomycetota bacterium]
MKNHDQSRASADGLSSAVTASSATVTRHPAFAELWARAQQGDSIALAPARTASAFELELVRTELAAARGDLVDKHVRAAERRGGTEERIEAVLRSGAMSRERTGFDRPADMRDLRERLAGLVQRGERIPLALLLGGSKAPNVLKTGRRFRPDASEWLAMTVLAAQAEAIGRVYVPGALVLSIPDAGLHTGDLGFPFHETAAHVTDLQNDLTWLGIDELVAVPDTLQHLPREWSDEVYAEAERVAEDMIADEALARDVDAQVRSLLFSINTRNAPWSFARALDVFHAAAGSGEGASLEARLDAVLLHQRAVQQGPFYVATNRLIRRLGLVDRVVEAHTGAPEHLRLSVHSKPGEPRPLLSMPNRHARMALLPMHGLGFRERDRDAARYATVFELEARTAGLRAVVSSRDGRFLFYEPASAHRAAAAA